MQSLYNKRKALRSYLIASSHICPVLLQSTLLVLYSIFIVQWYQVLVNIAMNNV